jgi:AdoMet-dependent rRNA methyltransferase SPB1
MPLDDDVPLIGHRNSRLQENVPMKSKMKEIEKLYARAKSGGKGKKGGKDGKRKGPPVDGRLRQDLKSQKRQALKKGKGKGRGKGKGKR